MSCYSMLLTQTVWNGLPQDFFMSDQPAITLYARFIRCNFKVGVIVKDMCVDGRNIFESATLIGESEWALNRTTMIRPIDRIELRGTYDGSQMSTTLIFTVYDN